MQAMAFREGARTPELVEIAGLDAESNFLTVYRALGDLGYADLRAGTWFWVRLVMEARSLGYTAHLALAPFGETPEDTGLTASVSSVASDLIRLGDEDGACKAVLGLGFFAGGAILELHGDRYEFTRGGVYIGPDRQAFNEILAPLASKLLVSPAPEPKPERPARRWFGRGNR